MYSGTILYYLKQWAALRGNAPAVTGGGSLTYAQLDDLSDRAAAALLRRGAGGGARIGVSYDHGFETLLSVLGIMKAGAAYVPLNPEYPPARLEYMTGDARVKMVLGGRGGLDVTSLAKEAKGELPDITPEDPMAVIYTSGSTGVPKGVVLTHKNPMGSARCYAETTGLQKEDAAAAYASLSFVVAINDFCSSLMAGAALCYVPRDTRVDMRKTAEFFARRRITHSIVPASLSSELAKTLRARALRSVTFVGEAFTPPKITPDYRVYNGYGSTEVAGIAAMGTSVKVRAIDGVSMRVNRRGELIISGPCVGEGYLNGTKPFGGEFHTGDLAKIDAGGEISVLGRLDFQVKIRGHRVQPEEIDFNARKLDGVSEAVTLFKDGRLTTYFSGSAEPGALVRHLERSLPRYMLPSDVVRAESLPRSLNGKIDRPSIPTAGSPPSSEKATFYTQTERGLAAIWSKLFEAAVSSRKDGFERFGGDSLTAMLLALEVESAFGKVVSPSELFKADTLEGQAKLIDGAEHHKVAAYNEDGRFPPLFFVHTANSGAEVYRNFLAALPAEQPVYVFENHNMLFSKGRFEGILRLAERYAGYLPPQKRYRLGGWSLGGLVAFEMGLLLQKRDIPSDLYLVDPYVIASEEERALSAVLESESCYQDYLSRDALFERFRKAGLMERLAEHNRFIRREITRYVPTGTFSGRVVLFRAMKADPADSEALCRLREMRRPDNGFSGFTTRLSIVPIDSAHDRCMSDAQAIKIIAAEIIKEAIMEKKLAVSATEGSLETVMEFIAQELRANGFTAKAVTQTLIAAEEIFVNIVRYAYAEGGKAEIMFSMENESAVIAFADSGKPYNPLEKAPPDIALSADERPVGGLGIFLTRRLTDGMEYERAGGRNILRIKKNQDNA